MTDIAGDPAGSDTDRDTDQDTGVPVPPPLPSSAADNAADSAGEGTTAGIAPLTSLCRSCGSQVRYSPGTTTLRCVSCGGEQPVAETDEEIDEHSFDAWVAQHPHTQVAHLAGHVTTCRGCGAQVDGTDLATSCQFCGGHLTLLEHPDGVVAPEAVVPFGVDRAGVQKAFRRWVTSRWFAPGALKKIGATESLRGTYLPHWTFDAHAHTRYSGQRGEHYYVTMTRSVPDGNGGTRTETYQERRTRWYPASGQLHRFFDDVLVPASKRIEPGKLAKMGPWRLADAVPFQPDYLSGYDALRYDVDPPDGAAHARREMRSAIEEDVRRDIGGDEQRVTRVDVSYAQVMFKLMLLPLWIATYLYGGKTWQVLVNANTGEVVGDRPWSRLKIAAAVVTAVVAAVLAWILISGQVTAPSPRMVV